MGGSRHPEESGLHARSGETAHGDLESPEPCWGSELPRDGVVPAPLGIYQPGGLGEVALPFGPRTSTSWPPALPGSFRG